MASLEHAGNKLCNNDYIGTQYSQEDSGLTRENGEGIGHFRGFLFQDGKSTKMESVLNGGLIKLKKKWVLFELYICNKTSCAGISLDGPLIAIVGVGVAHRG